MTTVNFTPPVACIASVTIAVDLTITHGSDFGSGANAYIYLTQNGVTYQSNLQPFSTIRMRMTLQYQFAVVAGLPCVVGFNVATTGATGAEAENVDTKVELIKL